MVSANPTGPVTVASARNGAYGDSVARLLAFAGHTVEREYYYNDSGTQMDRFRASVDARRTGEEIPEDGYRGDYVDELAARRRRPRPADARADPGEPRAVPDPLRRLGAAERPRGAAPGDPRSRLDTYEKDGALWARSGAYGDDNDRVLVRSATGLPTYRAADVPRTSSTSSHRGYDRLIYVLGADHHSYAKWYRAIAEMLGTTADSRRGADLPVRPPHPRRRDDKMSKRAATSCCSTS